MAPGPLDSYLARRSALLASGVPGTAAAERLADLTDAAVAHLAATAPRGRPFAVFALGGWGARRLLPGSDIDLLIVVEGRGADLRALADALLYPLWDCGLEVGHRTRTPREQVAAMRDDIEDLTAFLHARHVGGDPAYAAHARTAVARRLPAMARGGLQRLDRRERPGSPYLLEPDLKRGAGGQRDLDELAWRARLGGDGGRSADALARLGHAQDRITAARWLLHRDAGRSADLMTLDSAGSAGIDTDAVQRALEAVHHALLAVRDGAAPADPRPATLAELEAAAAEGPPAIEALERRAYAGGLDAIVPGFRDLLTLRRPALSHRYTVGAHALRTLTGLTGPGPAGRPAELGRDQLEPLLVAALAHDAGKIEPGPGHAGRGVAVAESAARRLGLDARGVARAGALVREHLLLSETSVSADLADEDVVLGAAARLGEHALVEPLFLLTAADMRATGPGVWTAWRAALAGELAMKMSGALSPDGDGAGLPASAEAVRSEALRQGLAEGAPRSVLDFCRQASMRYLARRTPDDVLRDARLVQLLAGPDPAGAVSLRVRAGQAHGTWRLDLATRDRPGLFSDVSGALTLAGMSVLAAEAYTPHRGIALDTFTVCSATRAPIAPDDWALLERHVTGALRGRLDLDTRLAERRRHYDRRRGPLMEPQVSVDAPGTFATRVHVRASDRAGLLHDLTRAIERAGLDIRRAQAVTEAGVVRDVFELVDGSGAPPDAAGLRERLTPALVEAAR